jgi:DNA-directed RNA polymerase subunit K/omega
MMVKKPGPGKGKQDGETTDAGKGRDKLSRDDVLKKSPSEYEAIVAIAKEARRLNAVPEVFLDEGEKAIPKAVDNFVDGKVDYEIDEDSTGRKPPRKGRRAK